MARFLKLRDSDRKMTEIRSHPEIQRFEAWDRGPRAESFRRARKYDDLFRRYYKRRADLYEMVARDEDLA